MEILLVHPEPSAREVALSALQAAGHSVLPVSSAEEALEAAALKPDGMARRALVTALVLPGALDGRALGVESRRRWPDVAMVYLVEDHEALEGMLLGPGDRYVLFPHALQALDQAVRRAVAGSAR